MTDPNNIIIYNIIMHTLIVDRFVCLNAQPLYKQVMLIVFSKREVQHADVKWSKPFPKYVHF